jgi:tetratricopeptide (TPR) repeat protein
VTRRPKEVSRSRGEAIRAKLRRAAAVSRDGDHEQALAIATEVQADLSAHGVESPHALWACAVFADYSGRFVDALDYINRALRADPAMVTGEHSLNLIANRARQALVDGDLGAEEGIRLYNALAAHALADDSCRVAFARFLLASGDQGEALRVAQAVALLNPLMMDAWRIVQAAAQALGDEHLAAEAASRCMSVRCAEGPSPVPNVGWGHA